MEIKEMVKAYCSETPAKDLAKKLEVSESLIFSIKSGRRNVTMPFLQKIFEVENWTWKDFVLKYDNCT